MARSTPHVRGGVLYVDGREPIAVGGPGWWRWLDARTSTTVRIEDAEPGYTVGREDRGSSGYWYGLRRGRGVLRKVYLGRSADLTAKRLQEAAEMPAEAGEEAHIVGRADAVASVVGLLRRSRVISLVGPGGVGKSRLAAAVACSREHAFADGVHAVPLPPPTTDPGRRRRWPGPSAFPTRAWPPWPTPSGSAACSSCSTGASASPRRPRR